MPTCRAGRDATQVGLSGFSNLVHQASRPVQSALRAPLYQARRLQIICRQSFLDAGKISGAWGPANVADAQGDGALYGLPQACSPALSLAARTDIVT